MRKPWFSIVCLLCRSSIVSSFFSAVFSFPKSFSSFLVLSFANIFLFYFLSSILLEFSKCLISHNIGCLIKTPWKNSTQTIFQGGSPWEALIFNSMFVVVVLYCVQRFFWSDVGFQNPFLLSFAIAVVSYLVQFSWHPLLDYYGVSMGFL